jgi:8-oxo-dGTP diphosphatase
MATKGRYVYEWPRPMVSVDAAVFGFFRSRVKRKPSWRLLLIKRKGEPFKGRWALPGGFVGIDEELEMAVERELTEETGLVNVALEQMHTFGRCGRDPRGRQITIVFMGVASLRQRRIRAGDDAANARWFDVGKLPKDLAFDHNEVVRFAIEKLEKRRINIKRQRKKQSRSVS